MKTRRVAMKRELLSSLLGTFFGIGRITAQPHLELDGVCCSYSPEIVPDLPAQPPSSIEISSRSVLE